MTECRKVQELTKEFLEKLSKIKAFKERIISLKSNNNFEYKRIRTKNINNNSLNDESKINALALFSRSGDIQLKNKILKPKKVPPISNSVFSQNENSKEKDGNIKISKKKLKPLTKPKTSEKSRDKNNFKIKQSKEEKKNDVKSSNDAPYKSKEEPIKKIKIV